jgi:hypothetical protein
VVGALRPLFWIVAVAALLEAGVSSWTAAGAFAHRAHPVQGVVASLDTTNDSWSVVIRFRDAQGREHELRRFKDDLSGNEVNVGVNRPGFSGGSIC